MTSSLRTGILVKESVFSFVSKISMVYENIKEAHVFIHGLEFPVIVYVCDRQQHEWVQCLNENLAVMRYTEEELCRWCIIHGIQYRIFVTERELENPIKRLRYKQIIRRLEVLV